MQAILMKTHQNELTVYSNIYDLKNKTITTYYQRDFNQPIQVHLSDIFMHGSCVVSLDSLVKKTLSFQNCNPIINKNFHLSTKTLYQKTDESKPESVLLKEVVIYGHKTTKKARLGWMRGKDGVFPFDTNRRGRGTVAMMLETPKTPAHIEKIQVRLMYNSKDTACLKLHFYSYGSANDCPGAELLQESIILKAQHRLGWLNFNMKPHNIRLTKQKFFVAFEWLEQQRNARANASGTRRMDSMEARRI